MIQVIRDICFDNWTQFDGFFFNEFSAAEMTFKSTSMVSSSFPCELKASKPDVPKPVHPIRGSALANI